MMNIYGTNFSFFSFLVSKLKGGDSSDSFTDKLTIVNEFRFRTSVFSHSVLIRNRIRSLSPIPHHVMIVITMLTIQR